LPPSFGAPGVSTYTQHELTILYQALAEPIGLVVKTDNLRLAASRLRRLRDTYGDPALKVLNFVVSPENPQDEIWIIRDPARVKKPVTVIDIG
jgi:hypothetical protein